MGRVALVTGGTRGIGRAIAIALEGAGRTVAANFAGNEKAAAEFTAETGIPAYRWDVGDFHDCQNGIANVEKDLGPIEILINNAGITRDVMLHKMAPEQWDDVIRTDLTSAFNMCRNVIEGMRDRGFGRIINVASINGQRGQLGQTNYCAAKSGLLGFTRALALETAKKGITVNALAPGYVDTDMVSAVPEATLKAIIAQIPVGRLGTAAEIAHCAVFLADDKTSFMTGATLTCNGAHYITG
jgi:acetoacetyl-CoA reductase